MDSYHQSCSIRPVEKIEQQLQIAIKLGVRVLIRLTVVLITQDELICDHIGVLGLGNGILIETNC